jgi:hypothetical protein
MQVARGKSAAALRERWRLPWQPVRFWRVGGVLTRTGGEGLPGVKSIRRTEMIERSAGVKHCRFCGAGLTGEAAYCSGCGRETVLRAVAHPMAQGEMRVAQEGWRYAPLWRRFLARALDVVLVLAAYYGFTFMLGAATGLVVGDHPGDRGPYYRAGKLHHLLVDRDGIRWDALPKVGRAARSQQGHPRVAGGRSRPRPGTNVSAYHAS